MGIWELHDGPRMIPRGSPAREFGHCMMRLEGVAQRVVGCLHGSTLHAEYTEQLRKEGIQMASARPTP